MTTLIAKLLRRVRLPELVAASPLPFLSSLVRLGLDLDEVVVGLPLCSYNTPVTDAQTAPAPGFPPGNFAPPGFPQGGQFPPPGFNPGGGPPGFNPPPRR